jgi:hypothetical protein
MKKMYGLVVLVMALASTQACGQSKPFIGYDKVKWGSTVEQVREAYGFGDDVVLIESSSGDPNIASLTQKNVSDSILSKQFLFNKWNASGYQLYRVIVKYSPYRRTPDQDFLNSPSHVLRGVLEKTYGQETSAVHGNGSLWVFGKFSPDIEVELISRSDEDQVTYTWRKYSDSYIAYRSKQAEEAERMRKIERESNVEL